MRLGSVCCRLYQARTNAGAEKGCELNVSVQYTDKEIQPVHVYSIHAHVHTRAAYIHTIHSQIKRSVQPVLTGCIAFAHIQTHEWHTYIYVHARANTTYTLVGRNKHFKFNFRYWVYTGF